jgi:molybdopterin/thiamine biosynthesis adenylyltransferase
LPSEYPKTSNDVFSLIKNASSENVELLYQLMAKKPRQATVVFGMHTENGPCLAGVTSYDPEESRFDQATIRPLERGFREGKTPPKILSQRFWQAATPATISNVVRADASWIHGRGKDARQKRLSDAAVTVIGCGSVGSQVAAMLAQAGIGHLTLIDPEHLSWSNVGRHKLGAKNVDQPKAEALAKALRENYPHLNIECRKDDWEHVLQKEPDFFTNCHRDDRLIISATGSWSSESALNVWHQGYRHLMPIVYGWTEAHGCAGHAVVIASDGGCLECGMNKFGSPNLSVADWTGATIQQREPACGASFQPYGPIELNYTNILIAEVALDVLLGKITQTTHHIWACRQSFLHDCGGSWSKEWQSLSSYQPTGGYMTSQAWGKNSNCLTCNNMLTP